MAKLQITMDDALKKEAERIIEKLGMTPKTAVTAFYEQIVEQKRIPFDLALSERQMKTRIIQRLAQDSLVRELNTDEKIEAWLNEE